MLVNTVSQLLEMSDGAVPEAIRGKIEKVWPVNKGNKGGKDYHIQKIVLVEGSKKIECMLDGRDALSRAAEGQQIYAMSVRGEKGISGLKRKDNDWDNKITPQVWIYSRAEVSFEGGGGQSYQQSAPQNNHSGNSSQGRTPNQPARQNTAPQNQHGSNHAPSNGGGNKPVQGDRRALRDQAMNDFDRKVGRSVAALSRCFDGAYRLAKTLDSRFPDTGWKSPSPEIIKDLAMGILVQATWGSKPADTDGFPLRDFQSIEAAEAEAAERAAQSEPSHEPAYN